MLKLLFFSSALVSLFILSPGVLAQNKDIQQPSLGIHLVLNSFSYRDSLNLLKAQRKSKFGIALNYLQGVTPHLDMNVTLSGSFLDYPDKSSGRKHLLTETDFSVREKLYPSSHSFNPFLQAGAGFSNFTGYWGVFLPVGPGLQVKLPGETFLLFHAQYRIPLSSSQSGHFYFSVGIAGILSSLHRHSHPLQNGVPIDSAPSATLAASAAGSRDSDGDGIPDKDDKCPSVPGSAAYQGCPPPRAIRKRINDDILKALERDAKLIFFQTDSATLLPASFTALDEVILILQQDTALKLAINGHTDNSGSAEKNQLLSERRAQAVRDYLVFHGHVDRLRLSATGYGSSRPISDNATAEGRARNRRVEFVLRVD